MAHSATYRGLPLHIENPKGSTRSGMAPDGTAWSCEMSHDYGDICGTVGADSDPVDVFLGDPNCDNELAYVVNQNDPATGAFDEHKVMLGFESETAARDAYLSNYEAGWTGLGSLTPLREGAFRDWLMTGDKSIPCPMEDTQQQDSIGVVAVMDAIMVGSHQYEEVADAAPGKLRIRILANLQGVKNQNGRLFLPEYNRAAAPIADARCRQFPIYGQEPHPVFDADVPGGWVTDSTREIWKQIGWVCDAAGSLWGRVEIDERTPRGARVAQKVRAGEKLTVSVRYEAAQKAPLRPVSDGTMAEVYDASSIDYCLPFALDFVPNPAFTGAGRYVTDSTESGVPVMDATDPAQTQDLQICTTPLEATDADEPDETRESDEPATAREATPGANPEINASSEASHIPSKEDAAPAIADAVTTMPELTETTETTAASVPVMDASAVAEIVARELAKAQGVADAKAADQKSVVDLADAVKDGTPESCDLSRFTATQRERIAARVARAATLADAKANLADAIADMDDMIAAATVAKITGVETVQAGAEGQAASGAEQRVQVVADAADKKIQEVQDNLNKAFDKVDRRVGRQRDAKLRQSNQEAVDTFMAGVFGTGAIRNAEGEIARQLVPQAAVADSANFVTASREQKAKMDRRPVLQALVDAKMVSAVAVTDAVVNTTNVLTQPVISQVIMRRMYQDLEALQYCEGFGAQSFTGAAGGPGAIGRALKLMTSYFVEPPHSKQGLRRGSLGVVEGAGIAKSGLVTGWQQFHVDSRSLSFDRSKEVEAAMAHGAINYDLLAEQYAENIAFFGRDTDSLLYLEMASFSDEVGAVAPATPSTYETVASGNLKNGNVQDGIAYGPTVVCVAQPDCYGAFAAPLANRISDNSANASVSNAYRVPVVMPRAGITVDTNGIESPVVTNPVTVSLGTGTPLVEGWLNRDGDIVGGDYAVDYTKGKFVFASSAGVTASTTNLRLTYSYSTNVTFTQKNFGSAGFPSGMQSRQFYSTILEKNDRIVAKRSQYPVYARPDLILGTEVASTPIKQADLFYNYLSPNGTELGITSDRTYARRDGIVYAQTNAPSILDDDTLLLMVRGFAKYGVDTPFQIDGPHPSYDGSGLLKNESIYKGQELFVIASPHARDVATKAPLQPKVTKHVVY